MESIRVVFGNQSMLLRDLLKRSLCKIDGVELAGETREMQELTDLVREHNAHWAVISLPLDEQIPEVFDELAAQRDDLSILAISDSGQKIKVRRVAVSEETYHEFSLEDLGAELMKRVTVPESASSA